jgi:riboflavin kinase/FMN adenylyltransferase
VRVLRGLDRLPNGLRFAFTVGVFDGMHLGHREVLRALADAARGLDAAAVAMTFDPHPEAIVRGAPPPLLCDLDERVARLVDAGVDHVVVQRFDQAFRMQSAEAFLDRLGRRRELAGLVMSPESAFGHDREGTIGEIRRLSWERGWRLVEVPVVERRGGRVSSGRIRGHIERGRLAEARALLGRRYAVVGEVVHGDSRGRSLGFPTANLHFETPVALPPDGIYAVRVGWAGPDPTRPARTADGVASLGIRPTFGHGPRLLEVHLLDFDGELYGERLRVELVRRQRGEIAFRTVDALVARIRDDVVRARRILAAVR